MFITTEENPITYMYSEQILKKNTAKSWVITYESMYLIKFEYCKTWI